MPAPGIAAKMACQVTPLGMKPPPALKLPGWNLNSSTMMARIGIATFHQVMPALTRENIRMARKLIAVKMAIRMTVIAKPSPVTFFVVRVVEAVPVVATRTASPRSTRSALP